MKIIETYLVGLAFVLAGVAITLAFLFTWLAIALYVLLPIILVKYFDSYYFLLLYAVTLPFMIGALFTSNED